MSMSLHSVKKEKNQIKLAKSEYEEIEIFEDENYWNLGYNIKLVKNNSPDKVLVMSHSNLDFQNGYIIKPKEPNEEFMVSRCQYCFYVMPGEFRGVYTKPYVKFKRGGQAGTQKLIPVDQLDENLVQYFEQHHQRYQLEKYNIPLITEDLVDDNLLPTDEATFENEGMAPPVKSAWRP